ncbi:hypothetical protein N0V90_010747 [Kalmusia sp. IMI 367209]|nr:hypothetical protein N0V90_010747 [Kalmusia sp. IMI 367209]
MEMDEPNSQSSASVLCEKCFIALNFDDQQPSYSGRRFGENIQPNASHHDFLPSLPNLAKSGEAGCTFCTVLRAATLMLRISSDGEIGFTFQYIWTAESTREPGLKALEVHIGSIEGVEVDTELIFAIDAPFGK